LNDATNIEMVHTPLDRGQRSLHVVRCQAEPIERVAARVKATRRFQGVDCRPIVARLIFGDAQQLPETALLGSIGNALAGKASGPLRVAKPRIGACGQ